MLTRCITALALAAALAGCNRSSTTHQASTSTAPDVPKPHLFADADLASRMKATIDTLPMTPRPRDISVSEADGVVTIRGTVSTYTQKHLIENAVRDASDVRRVDSRLIVGYIDYYN